MLRARTAGLDPTMRLDTWDEPDDLSYDRMLLSDLTSLRFAGAGHGVVLLGPVGVGKTHLATALGHIGIRRCLSVHASRNERALLAQSAIDRLTSGAHTLIIEGPSYRQRDRLNQRASVDTQSEARDAH